MSRTKYTRADLERILAACENVPGYATRAKAIRDELAQMTQREADNG